MIEDYCVENNIIDEVEKERLVREKAQKACVKAQKLQDAQLAAQRETRDLRLAELKEARELGELELKAEQERHF